MPNGESSTQDIHRALWGSYARLNPIRGFPADSENSIEKLSGDLLKRPASIPKPILTLGALRLLPNHPPIEKQADVDLSKLADLDALLRDLTGSTAKEILDAYGDSDDRLLVLAELYGLLDYQESVRTPLLEKVGEFPAEFAVGRGVAQDPAEVDKTIVGASLALSVQMDLERIRGVVHPAAWFKNCGLFWDDPDLDTTEQTRVDGTLRLPGLDQPPIDVTIDVEISRDAFGTSNHYKVKQGQTMLCSGLLEIRKEMGRPGASRITHEKRARFAGGPLRDAGGETLQYWVQAETLCLFLPP